MVAVGLAGGAAGHIEDGGLRGVFAAVAEGGGSGAVAVVLLPYSLDSQRGAGGVVESGMSVLEAHVDDADNHSRAVVAVGEVGAVVYVVDSHHDTCAVERGTAFGADVNQRTFARF